MSKYTDKTNIMVDRFKREIEHFKNKGYKVELKIPQEVYNKDSNILEEVKYNFKRAQDLAEKYGFLTEYKIVKEPEQKRGYNCVGCRKRKTGNYMWFGYNLVPNEKNYTGWFNRIGKVCSPECSEIMLLRLA